MTLTCHHCGVIEEPDLGWQVFGNGTTHLRAECRACGRYIKYVPQTPENLSLAPLRPLP